MHGYHEGEVRVQEKVGVRDLARRRESLFQATVPPRARQFLEQRRMLFLATLDAGDRPWASVLTGEPGFARAPDPGTVRIEAEPLPADPLGENLNRSALAGLLAIDLERRMRMRVNGRARREPDGVIVLRPDQVYSNCPKYIQARRIVGEVARGEPTWERATSLDDARRAWIRGADTFFIATANPGEGVDASHRGGRPGFVEVAGDRLTWPDYAGNSMFCTLGNLEVHPRAGLTFVDFERGSVLQLTGRARVDWDPARAAGVPGAERLVSFDVEEVVETRHAVALRLTLEEYSPFNPRP